MAREIVWEDFELDEEQEYQSTRKMQDEEWERALKEEEQKNKKQKTIQAATTIVHQQQQPPKKSKILEKPLLMDCDENACTIHLRFRCFTGKIISCKFHRDELISHVLQQVQWELKITSQIELVVMRNKLEAHKTLSQSNVLDRTMIFIENA